MRKIFLICSLLISVVGVGQTVVQRANQANTVADGRWMGNLNSFQPRYADTTAANLSKGIDSAGAIIYTYDIKGFWYRQHSPKKWVRIVSDNNLSNNFFFDTTCNCYKIDTTSLMNIINNFISDSSVTSISILNDSTIRICYGNGTCINFGIVTNITNINSVYFLSGDSIVVCNYDTLTLTQTCDTIALGTNASPNIFQNWLRNTGGNVVEFGGIGSATYLVHDTYADTYYYTMNFSGATVSDYPYRFLQRQGHPGSTGIVAFNRLGNYNEPNSVRLGINQWDSVRQYDIPGLYGYFGQRNGYGITTNFNSNQANTWKATVDNSSSKMTGIFFNTTDGWKNNEAATIFGLDTSHYNLSGHVSDSLSAGKIATFNTDLSVKFWGYNSDNFLVNDTGRYKIAVFDTVDGTFMKGYWLGAGGSANTRYSIEKVDDSIQLKNDSATFVNNNVYTGDSTGAHWKRGVILDQTNSNYGDELYMYDTSQSIVRTRPPVGREYWLRFIVGESGAPIVGSTTYTNTQLINKRIEFYVEGFLQYDSSGRDYTFDATTGTITSNYEFDSLQGIQIHAFDTASIYDITGGGVLLEYINFTTVSGITESPSHVWNGNNGGSYSNLGLADKKIASTDDGYVLFQYAASDGQDAILGMNVTNANVTYGSFQAGVWVSSGTVYKIDNGSVASTGGTANTGDYLRINIVGNVITIEKSTDGGVTWPTVLATLGYTRSADMYINTNIDLNKKLYYPQGYNLSN